MAQEQDVKLIACTMTMDLLSLQEEELLDNIEYAGVAAYPRDQTYQIKIKHDGKVSESEISTFENDGTCIITIQLT